MLLRNTVKFSSTFRYHFSEDAKLCRNRLSYLCVIPDSNLGLVLGQAVVMLYHLSEVVHWYLQ